MPQPQIITGGSAKDERGTIEFNNEFHLSEIKRLYIIHNHDVNYIRGWQGHLIEQRWFTAIVGDFEIHLIDFNKFIKGEIVHTAYVLKSSELQTLHVPSGYMSAIKAITPNNKLLIHADYLMNEIKDEYRYDLGHFGIF